MLHSAGQNTCNSGNSMERTPVTVLKRTPVTMLNSAADDKNDCWYVEHLVPMNKSYSQCGNIVSKKEND